MNAQKFNVGSIFIAIVFTALVAGGGVYFWQNYLPKSIDVEEVKTIDESSITAEEKVSKKLTLEAVTATYYSQIKKVHELSDYSVVLYSSDAKEDTATSCAKGYFAGNFNLGLVYKNNEIVNAIELGNLVVSPDAIHTDSFPVGGEASISAGESIDKYILPFVMVENYSDCNSNLFNTFFVDDGNSLMPAVFGDTNTNQMFAKSIEDISFDLYSVGFKVYDNSTQKWMNKSYNWDEKLKKFSTL